MVAIKQVETLTRFGFCVAQDAGFKWEKALEEWRGVLGACGQSFFGR